MFGYKLNELEDDGYDLSWRDVTELIRHTMGRGGL